MTTGRLIAITGPAAAGKSTLAKALQAQFAGRGELWLTLELDLFARGLPRDWIGVAGRQGRYADRGFIYARNTDGSIALRLGPDARRVLAAFHRSVAATVRSGVPVICETIVYDEEDWRDWHEALDGIVPCWVKLGAPIETLEHREQAERTRLFQGLARGMMARRAVGAFDIEADSAAEPAEAIAKRIVTALGS